MGRFCVSYRNYGMAFGPKSTLGVAPFELTVTGTVMVDEAVLEPTKSIVVELESTEAVGIVSVLVGVTEACGLKRPAVPPEYANTILKIIIIAMIPQIQPMACLVFL